MSRKSNDAAHPQPRVLPPPSRIEALMEKQLETMAAAVEECLRRAGKVEEGAEVWGHIRNEETADAVKLADSCARLVEAVAKVRGRFDHRIRVQRENLAAAAAPECDPFCDDEPGDERYWGERAEKPAVQARA